jgi:uncharacterized protein (TIGR03435 family)
MKSRPPLRSGGPSGPPAGWIAAVVLLASATAFAQATSSAPAAFEVASIRRSTSATPGGSSSRMQPGGSYAATNMTLQQLVAAAYGIPTTRVLNGPGWLSTDRYDIVAKAAGDPTTEETARLLQTLLRERFSLTARQEQRVLPVYALTLARPAGEVGPRLWRSDTDCTDRQTRINLSSPAELAARPVCRVPLLISKDVSLLIAGDIPMTTLGQMLTSASGRPVIDRTGLTGRFDVSLEWAASADVDGSVSVFTAVQEQLGLRLESTTAPLDVVIIERVERPTEN